METSADAGVAFFDIGDTLASVTLSVAGGQLRLAVYPQVPTVLGRLSERGARLGILSSRGSIPAEMVIRALRDCGLWDFSTRTW